MFKALFKKQMSEIGSFLVQDAKTGKRRTAANKVGFYALLVLVALMMFAIFGMGAVKLCKPLTEIGLTWFYFAIMGLLSIALGVFASVFNTYASLYIAKDNEALLSMPIPSWMIMTVRMLGVYVMGLAYESFVMLPAIVVYLVTAGFSAKVLVFSVLTTISISFIILILSCVLGWVVAFIATHLKNKSFVIVVVSIIFIVLYYFSYTKIIQFISDVAAYGEKYAASFQKTMFYFCWMGKGAEGDIVAFLLFTCIAIAVMLVCFYVISRSFASFATTNKGTTKKAYVETNNKPSKPKEAILAKEFLRFSKSATYMLNCGLGVFIYVVLIIGALWQKESILSTIEKVFGESADFKVVLAVAAICMIATTDAITAPTISLEGKTLWIMRTLPIDPWEVFKAKIKVHCYVNGIPAIMATSVLVYVLKITGVDIICVTATVCLFIFFHAQLGLILNIKNPNFSWSTEAVPIKQSASVFISIFGGMIVIAGMVIGYNFSEGYFDTTQYLAIWMFAFAIINRIMIGWLKKKGVAIFESY